MPSKQCRPWFVLVLVNESSSFIQSCYALLFSCYSFVPGRPLYWAVMVMLGLKRLLVRWRWTGFKWDLSGNNRSDEAIRYCDRWGGGGSLGMITYLSKHLYSGPLCPCRGTALNTPKHYKKNTILFENTIILGICV